MVACKCDELYSNKGEPRVMAWIEREGRGAGYAERHARIGSSVFYHLVPQEFVGDVASHVLELEAHHASP